MENGLEGCHLYLIYFIQMASFYDYSAVVPMTDLCIVGL